ncbi:MAG: cytosol nonspecific dipeptidase [Bacteroidetes bacterium GWF2_29_10]|nr:MAG: cytosol nonspecific dipeptidase [Bacteroidetes bacterium GWF2_29_10]
MNSIINLEPKALWENFNEICKIPHPSKKEEHIIEFMRKFGIDNGLDTFVDEVGNVIIKKNATPGFENRKAVVLQAHLDMVPQKNSDTNHDFEKDPIETIVDGEWVRANGTTLGADNGIGVAAAMAVLKAKNLKHGPVVALFTIDEETGMTGAFGLKPGLFDADILLNLDSEDEGELYIGCAGGVNANVYFDYNHTPIENDTTAFQITVKGLKGGHSGVDINLQRGNSNKIINRIFFEGIKQYGLRIASIDGGSLRNAIPRESFAVVTVPNNKKDAFVNFVKEFGLIVKNELGNVDPGVMITAENVAMPSFLIDKDTQDRLIKAVYACPNGVIRMISEMEGVVETSTNLAIIKSDDKQISVMNLLRSSVDSAKQDLGNMVESVFTNAGAKVILDGAYPGWKPNVNSPILKTMQEIYNKKFGKVPEIKVIHAGLECGLLGGVYKKLDMISFGPTICFPHSPDEKVNIETVNKFWIYLVETLENIPVK